MNQGLQNKVIGAEQSFEVCINPRQRYEFKWETACQYLLPHAMLGQGLVKPYNNAAILRRVPSLFGDESCPLAYASPQNVLMDFTYCESSEICDKAKKDLVLYTELAPYVLGVVAVHLLAYNVQGDCRTEGIIVIGSASSDGGFFRPKESLVVVNARNVLRENYSFLHELTHATMEYVYNNDCKPKDASAIEAFKSDVIKPYLFEIAVSYNIALSEENDVDRLAKDIWQNIPNVPKDRQYKAIMNGIEEVNWMGRGIEGIQKFVNSRGISTDQCKFVATDSFSRCVNDAVYDFLDQKDKEVSYSVTGPILNMMHTLFISDFYQDRTRLVSEFIAKSMEQVVIGGITSPVFTAFRQWMDKEFIPDSIEFIASSPHCSQIWDMPGVICKAQREVVDGSVVFDNILG